MPPQLQLSLLNVPPAMDAIAALPRPQHVILNHIYLQARGGVGELYLRAGVWGTVDMLPPRLPTDAWSHTGRACTFRLTHPSLLPCPAAHDHQHACHGGGHHAPVPLQIRDDRHVRLANRACVPPQLTAHGLHTRAGRQAEPTALSACPPSAMRPMKRMLTSPRRYKPKKRPQQGSVQQPHHAAAHPAASDVSMHGAAASPRASQGGGTSQTSPMMG